MHDVSIREGSVLAAEEARVLLIHEEAEVRAEAAVLVAHPFRERGMRAHERLERLAQRRGVERDVTRSVSESAVGAVEKHSHMSTTNGSGQAGQPSEDEGASRNSRMRTTDGCMSEAKYKASENGA